MQRIFYACLVAVGILGFVANAHATLIFTLGGCDFSVDGGGSGTCGGSGNDLNNNVMTIKFDTLSATTVRMSVATDPASNWPAGADKISDIWINHRSTFLFSEFTFANVTTGITIPTAGLAPAANAITGPGNVSSAGIFSIQFSYPTGGGAEGPFNPGELSVIDITRSLGLSESDFDFLSTSPGPTGALKAAFHLNVTGNGQSGHYGNTIIPPGPDPGPTPVPEPATMLLLGTGLAGVARAAGRRRKKK